MIVVDTSAIVAILRREADAPALRAAIAGAARILISAVSVVELAAVSSRDETLFDGVRDFLNEPFVVVEPVDRDQAAAAVDAYIAASAGDVIRRASISGTSSPMRGSNAGAAAVVQGRRFCANGHRRGGPSGPVV